MSRSPGSNHVATVIPIQHERAIPIKGSNRIAATLEVGDAEFIVLLNCLACGFSLGKPYRTCAGMEQAGRFPEDWAEKHDGGKDLSNLELIIVTFKKSTR